MRKRQTIFFLLQKEGVSQIVMRHKIGRIDIENLKHGGHHHGTSLSMPKYGSTLPRIVLSTIDGRIAGPLLPCHPSGPFYLATHQAPFTLSPIRPLLPCHPSGPFYLATHQTPLPCHPSGPFYLATHQTPFTLPHIRPLLD